MKQRITFIRTETITMDLDYAVNPHTRANAEFWANRGFCGQSPIGRPETDKPVGHNITEWRVSKAETSLLPTPEPKPTTKTNRK